MTDKKKLKVNIFDKDYSLLVENEDLAADLAKYVNNMMNETRDEMPSQSTETVAVIAALNIAYDLFIEKNKFREFSINESKIMSSPS